MKQGILNFLIKINVFLSHLINLGFKDGIKLFFLKASGDKNYSVILKSLKHPFTIRGNSSDKLVIDQVFYQKDYEISIDFDPKVIVDCGANIGLASLFFTNKYKDCKIIAVEPEKDNFNLLALNSKPYPNIFLENKGIWSESCHLNIVSGEDNLPWSFYVEPTVHKTETTIEAIGIAEIIEKYDLKQIDILKIDIEGSEENLFEKNVELWLPYVKVMIIELHDRFKPLSSRPFFEVLSKNDFSIYFKGENIIATQLK